MSDPFSGLCKFVPNMNIKYSQCDHDNKFVQGNTVRFLIKNGKEREGVCNSPVQGEGDSSPKGRDQRCDCFLFHSVFIVILSFYVQILYSLLFYHWGYVKSRRFGCCDVSKFGNIT